MENQIEMDIEEDNSKRRLSISPKNTEDNQTTKIRRYSDSIRETYDKSPHPGEKIRELSRTIPTIYTTTVADRAKKFEPDLTHKKQSPPSISDQSQKEKSFAHYQKKTPQAGQSSQTSTNKTTNNIPRWR